MVKSVNEFLDTEIDNMPLGKKAYAHLIFNYDLNLNPIILASGLILRGSIQFV